MPPRFVTHGEREAFAAGARAVAVAAEALAEGLAAEPAGEPPPGEGTVPGSPVAAAAEPQEGAGARGPSGAVARCPMWQCHSCEAEYTLDGLERDFHLPRNTEVGEAWSCPTCGPASGEWSQGPGAVAPGTVATPAAASHGSEGAVAPAAKAAGAAAPGKGATLAPVPAALAPVATAPAPEDWEVVVPQAVPLSVSLAINSNDLRDGGRARCESAWHAGVALAPWYYGAEPTAPDIPKPRKARIFLGVAPGRVVFHWKKASVNREVHGWEGCGSRDALLVLGLGSKAELNCMLDGLGGH